jgi:hypothetical protein
MAAATEPLDQTTPPGAAAPPRIAADLLNIGLYVGTRRVMLGQGIWPGVVLALAVALPDPLVRRCSRCGSFFF